MAMRGLTIFISDIRNCPNKEQEAKVIEKEMAKIRKKFREATKLSTYDKKKYVWKMLYMFVLGYDIDFGHMEAINLISGVNWSEKQVGYLAVALLLNENHDFLRLIINSVRNDLLSKNDDIQTLSLNAIANIGGREFAESLTGDVQKIFLNAQSRPFVKKKSSLCLLRLFRKYPEVLRMDEVHDRVLALLDDRNLGVITSVTSLLLGLAAEEPSTWEDCVPQVVKVLAKVTHSNAGREFGSDYLYYSVMCPWLQVRLLRVLQYFPGPSDSEVSERLSDVLDKIITDTTPQKNVNRNNAMHAVMFEAIACAIHIESDDRLLSSCVAALGRFISSKESNYRYLALETMQQMAAFPSLAEPIKEHQQTVIAALKDKDVSIRRRSLDVLYEMCDTSNSKEIVYELISYLNGSDYSIREELVLRVAILAEKFAQELNWYVDTILQLIQLAGDHVSEDIWFRVVQIVTNHKDLQPYAAENVFKALQKEPVHENMVNIGGYILGEFGTSIEDNPSTRPAAQFELLLSQFGNASVPTKCILLSAFVKMAYCHAGLKDQISNVFENLCSTMDTELQQRAVEYLSMSKKIPSNVLDTVLDAMPEFEARESALLKRIKAAEGTTADKSTRVKGGSEERDEEPEEPVQLPAVKTSEGGGRRAGGGDAGVGDLLSMGDEPSTAPTVTAQAPSAGLDDLLGGGMDSGSMGGMDMGMGMGMGMGSTAPAPAAGGMDLLGGDDLLGGGAAPPPSTGGSDGLMDLLGGSAGAGDGPASEEDKKTWYTNLLSSQEGLLYQDQYISVAVKMQWQGNMGKVVLLYTNKLAEVLDKFNTIMQQIPSLQIQSQQVGPMVGAKAQVQQTLQLSLIEPFQESPKFKVQFMAQGKPVNIEFKLPVHPVKFFQPVPLQRDAFFQYWNQFSQPPLEFTTVFKAKGPAQASTAGQTLAALNLSVCNGVDPNPANVAAAAKLNCARQEVPVLVRLESNQQAQAYRLTVHAAHGSVTAAVKNAVMAQIAAST